MVSPLTAGDVGSVPRVAALLKFATFVGSQFVRSLISCPAVHCARQSARCFSSFVLLV